MSGVVTNLRRGRRAVLAVPAALAAGLLFSEAAGAIEPCAVFAPGADGVLRLDGGAGGHAAGCRMPRPDRASDALPEAFESHPSRPKRGPVQAQPQPPATIQSQAQPQVQAQPAPPPQAAARSDERPATDVSSEDVARLKSETAHLKDEVARLSEEATRLRSETTRLRNELVAREVPGPTATITPPARAPQAGSSQVGKAGSGAATDKTEAKVDSGSGVVVVAPKGDLLIAVPQTSEVSKTPPDRKAEAQAPDERAFERQKGVVERAWKQLLDLAGRMKADVSGKPE